METFRSIECFVRIARDGSFAKAAQCMSDISCGAKGVTKLKVRLGVRLFSTARGNSFSNGPGIPKSGHKTFHARHSCRPLKFSHDGWLIPFLMKRIPIEVKTHAWFTSGIGSMSALAKGRGAFESVICQFWSLSVG